MEKISNNEFFAWASGAGIGFDERYPGAQSLAFMPDRHLSRFWALPRDAGSWPYFAACFLEGVDPWSVIVVWPRAGRWPDAANSADWNESVRDVMLRGAGIPQGWVGAIRCSRQEMVVVIAVMFIYLAFGWCPADDLYLIPDHGQQYIQTNHHDVVHVEFLNEKRLSDFVAYMEFKGYPLPTKVPDGTFKRPSWMQRGGA